MKPNPSALPWLGSSHKSKKIHKRKRVHKEKKVKRHNKTLAQKVLDKKKRQEFLSTHVKIGGKWYVL